MMSQYLAGMELVDKLCSKEHLDTSDTLTLLRYLQEEATPFLPPPTSTSNQTERCVSTSMIESKRTNISEEEQSLGGSRGVINLSGSHRREEGVARSKGEWPREGTQDSRRVKPITSRSQREPLDLTSVNEFPPISSATSSSGKRNKSSSSNRSTRRIKPTPLAPQTDHTPNHFARSMAPRTHPGPEPWNSNPAFTSHSTSPSSTTPVPIPQALEIKILKQNKPKPDGNMTRPLLKSVPSTFQSADSSHVFGQSADEHISESFRLVSLEDRMTGRGGGEVMKDSVKKRNESSRNEDRDFGIDSKIANLSLLPLTNSSADNSHAQSPDVSVVLAQTLNTSDIIQDLVVSTPQRSTPKSNLIHACPSLERVTNMEMLQHVADLYATLVKEGRVSNLTSEIYFVIQLLTLSGANQKAETSGRQLSGLFGCLDSCVYFAVAVLSRIKDFLVHLDKPTLKLLGDNQRIVVFQPKLATFFTEAWKMAAQEVSPNSRSHADTSTSNSVLFQEDTDNSRNFPGMKAFHAFKKQRDLFYSIFREWELNQNNSGWVFREKVSDQLKLLIREYGSVCSLSHLANLFQKQLVQSCRRPGSGNLDNSSLPGQIKNTDPHRLSRLAERFILPSSSSSGTGVCPPPSFTTTEEFFKAFILEADSYIFNQHLKNALFSEIVKLHQTCSSALPKEVPDLLHSLRIAAKFLGFLDFLPYTSSGSSCSTVLQAAVREQVQSFNLLEYISEAKVKGHLCLTVPWVVQYLSMMDSQGAKVTYYHTAVVSLMELYRRLIVDFEPANRGTFLSVTSLGWLFEIPNVPNELFFDQLGNSSVDNSLSTQTDTTKCLDSQADTVSTGLLYACCPYLSEIRSLLVEFTSGLHSKQSPLRKIKPLSTRINKIESSPTRQLQLQLQENLFRSHPPYLKQVCGTTSERVSASAIAHCTSSIVQTSVGVAIEQMADWMRGKCAMCDENTDPFTKEEGEWVLIGVLDTVYQSACQETRTFFNKYYSCQVSKALNVLLDQTISAEVVTVTSWICTDWALQRSNKWITEELKELLREELTKGLERTRRLIKTASRVQSPSRTSYRKETSVLAIERPQTAAGTPGECASVEKVTEQVTRGCGLETTRRLFSEFKVVAGQLISHVQDSPELNLHHLLTTLNHLSNHLNTTAYIVPSVPLPQVLPIDCEEMCFLSVGLATHLVSQGLLQPLSPTPEDASPLPYTHITSSPRPSLRGECLEALIRFWISLKGLKMEVPLSELLSAKAFAKYFEKHQQVSTVWESLGAVVTAVVDSELTSSALMEGMWMCRQLQVSEHQQQALLMAAAVFLQYWYTGPITATNKVTMQPCDSHMTMSRQIHFTRLLSVVIDKLDDKLVPEQLQTVHNISSVLSVHY